MTEVFFADQNFVGREIENVQDLVKAVAAKMDISFEGEFVYTYYYKKEVEDEDGSVTYEDAEKTDDEFFDDMRVDLMNGHKLYAGFCLDCRTWDIVPAKRTTLQSDFRIGQTVYVMRKNKITTAKVAHISLASDDGKNRLDEKASALAESLYNQIAGSMMSSYESFACYRRKYVVEELVSKALNGSHIIVVTDDKYCGPLAYDASDVFATKEELVKHLLEN